MSTNLSKAQIRMIQTLNECLISTNDAQVKPQKFSTLYILSTSSFYIVSSQSTSNPISSAIQKGQSITLNFKDKKEPFTCIGQATIIQKDDEDFEDASEFFTIDPSKIDHIIAFTIASIG